MKKIFIACPISKYIDGDNFTNDNFKIFIEKIYNICEKYVPDVFLALRREEYGKKKMVEECTALDFEEMKSADFVVAIPDDSMGVAVELGWASSMKKHILLILNQKQKYTPLISGLIDITNTEIIWFNVDLNQKVLRGIDSALKRSKENAYK